MRTGTELPTGGALWRDLRTDESQAKAAQLLKDVRQTPLTPKFDIDSSFSTPPLRSASIAKSDQKSEEKLFKLDDVPEISLPSVLSTPPKASRRIIPKHSSKKDSKPSLIGLDSHDPSIVCRLFASPRQTPLEKKSAQLLEFSPEKPDVVKEDLQEHTEYQLDDFTESPSAQLTKVKEEIDELILSLIHPNPLCRLSAKAVIERVKRLEAQIEMLSPSMRVADSPEWLSSGISTMDLGS